MLKYMTYIFGSILVLAILAVGAYVPPTYATSAPVVLIQIQAGAAGAALQEIVVLYNNSSEEVDITGWCLQNKSSIKFACFSGDTPEEAIYLPAHSTASVSSTALSMYFEGYDFSLTYAVTNQSSGSIVGGNDTISLLDAAGEVVDRHSWTTSLVAGMLFERVVGTVDPFVYHDTDQASDWQITYLMRMPEDMTEVRTREIDDNIEPAAQLFFSELLPNAVGSDVGQEFIELFNPNDKDVDLGRYTVWVGPEFDKNYQFPTGAVIPAHSYRSFTNQEIGYSLLNTSSRVRLSVGDEIIDETPLYTDPADGQAWVLIEGNWQYTSTPTPGESNSASGVAAQEADEVNAVKPCAANQYRNEETNRCRLIAVAQTTPAPCKDNQYRSEETNRCRNIATETGPAPCAEGQERNPETNRCRNIKAIAMADYGVLGAQTKTNAGPWYLWAAVGGIILLILGYAVWEWRYEIGKLLQRMKGVVFARFRK